MLDGPEIVNSAAIEGIDDAKSVPLPDGRRRDRRHRLWRDLALANFVTPKPREMTVTIPPDKFLKK